MTAPSSKSSNISVNLIAAAGIIAAVLLPPFGLFMSVIMLRRINKTGIGNRALAEAGIIIGGLICLAALAIGVLAFLFSKSNLVTP